jgi:hypothetical protein
MAWTPGGTAQQHRPTAPARGAAEFMQQLAALVSRPRLHLIRLVSA